MTKVLAEAVNRRTHETMGKWKNTNNSQLNRKQLKI